MHSGIIVEQHRYGGRGFARIKSRCLLKILSDYKRYWPHNLLFTIVIILQLHKPTMNITSMNGTTRIMASLPKNVLSKGLLVELVYKISSFNFFYLRPDLELSPEGPDI